MTKEKLAEALRAAEKAHEVYEALYLTGRDEKWADWYADYIVQMMEVEK